MDFIERATKVAKEVGESVVDSTKNIGTTIYTSLKEQSEVVGLGTQKSQTEERLQGFYAEIGKRYVEFVKKAEEGAAFDAADIMETMRPDLDKLEEIAAALKEKELAAKKEEEEKAQQKAQGEFDCAKAKLDQALQMDIITKEEYEEKLVPHQKKLDNYIRLNKIDMQLQMGIITKEEHDKKIADLLQ